MSGQPFPQRRPDGSFSVEIRFVHQAPRDSALWGRLREYLDGWRAKNGVWQRDWSNGVVEHLRFEDEFLSAPYPVRLDDDGTVGIRLDAKPTATCWKDWMVLRIVKALIGAFPELGDVVSFKSADGPSE